MKGFLKRLTFVVYPLFYFVFALAIVLCPVIWVLTGKTADEVADILDGLKDDWWEWGTRA